MGKSYCFECPRCGYRARVSGRAEEGLNFAVQTIHCRDCRSLYDAVVRLRVPDFLKERHLGKGLRGPDILSPVKNIAEPPPFEAVVNRLPFKGVKYYKWMRFKPQCPIAPFHRVEEWNAPAKCPRCRVFLEQNAIPFRLWD